MRMQMQTCRCLGRLLYRSLLDVTQPTVVQDNGRTQRKDTHTQQKTSRAADRPPFTNAQLSCQTNVKHYWAGQGAGMYAAARCDRLELMYTHTCMPIHAHACEQLLSGHWAVKYATHCRMYAASSCADLVCRQTTHSTNAQHANVQPPQAGNPSLKGAETGHASLAVQAKTDGMSVTTCKQARTHAAHKTCTCKA